MVVDVEIIRQGNALVLFGVDEADVLLREQKLGAIPRVFPAQHRHIQTAVQHLLIQLAAVAGGDIQPDSGVLAVVLRQDVGQAVVGEIDGDAGPQRAAHLAPHGVEAAAQFFHLVQGGAAVFQHLFARRGKADALPGAEQDVHAQLLLDGFDPLGECGLSHVQLVGGMGDVAGLVEDFQQFKVFFVHRSVFTFPFLGFQNRFLLYFIPYIHDTTESTQRKARIIDGFLR